MNTDNFMSWGANLMPKVKSGLYLFIIWEKSRNKTDRILDDLREKFTIRDVYEIKWSEKNFLNNLKRFYGQSLPDAQKKAELCGMGPFLLIIVTDPCPDFIKTKTVFERDLVNVHIHDSKVKYREWIGKDFTVHSSVSENETDHNLSLLFGKNMNDFENELPEKWAGSVKRLELDLSGHNGWKDMKQLLYILNGTVNYVILRNFENMPVEFDYRDVDILAEDEKLAYIINRDFSPLSGNSRSFETEIGGKLVAFNPNYLGDHYYDIKWEKDILKRRVLHQNGFYVPCKEDHFYTLLYHVIIHKRMISDRYKKMLNNIAKELNMNKISEETFDDFEKSRHILEEYLSRMSYQNSSTVQYKITHNELMRLVKAAIFLTKTQGIQVLMIAVLGKIKATVRSIKDNK